MKLIRQILAERIRHSTIKISSNKVGPLITNRISRAILIRNHAKDRTGEVEKMYQSPFSFVSSILTLSMFVFCIAQ